MSIAGDRAAIVAALADVDDVTAHEYRPRTMPAGTAWPLLGRLSRGDSPDFEATWRVVVILPAGEVPASKWFDAHHEPIAEALADDWFVDAIEPGLVETDAGDLEARFLTVRKEA